ncbi:energy transducer TonB [Carboxylicivirga caseinilyticus]|uniref:energy transducer TonB n=1 Tax=Carboxylicivirga caseinilyticus TaxID=3417572 RepID=UPI003D359816|nr:hypothetical protein [Marinilabiliaceae bacterium A049]
MKRFWFIFFILFLSINVIGQETIIKTEYYNNSKQVRSHSYVLKSDSTIKHGEAIYYKKIDEQDYKYFKGKNHDRLVVANGQFYNNIKVGIWEFFLNPKFYYDFNKNKLITFQLHNYPILAYELGIQGDVIIKYDIDASGRLKNIIGIQGDSILIKGTINNFNKLNLGQAENLKIIAEILENWERKNIIDTLKYRLE